LDRMSLKNISKFVAGYAARKDISEEMKKLTMPKLVMYGENASIHDETEEMREYLSYKSTEFVSFPDFGHLLTEECPEKLLDPITFFFNSMGYYLQSKKFERRSQWYQHDFFRTVLCVVVCCVVLYKMWIVTFLLAENCCGQLHL